jgi:hypothetical protein
MTHVFVPPRSRLTWLHEPWGLGRRMFLALAVPTVTSWKVMLLGVHCLIETQHGHGHDGKGRQAWSCSFSRSIHSHAGKGR